MGGGLAMCGCVFFGDGVGWSWRLVGRWGTRRESRGA